MRVNVRFWVNSKSKNKSKRKCKTKRMIKKTRK